MVKESQVVELGDLQKGMKDVVVEGMVPSSSRLNEYAAKSKPSDVLIVVNMLGKDKWHGQNAAANVAGKVGVHSLTTWLRTLYPTPSSWLRCAQAEKAAAAAVFKKFLRSRILVTIVVGSSYRRRSLLCRQKGKVEQHYSLFHAASHSRK